MWPRVMASPSLLLKPPIRSLRTMLIARQTLRALRLHVLAIQLPGPANTTTSEMFWLLPDQAELSAYSTGSPPGSPHQAMVGIPPILALATSGTTKHSSTGAVLPILL